ncbi:protein of avirulence locus [Alsobacter metallidurans]|uniref:Protein of avirulence locus n=1 Tax=Alsobacter metallidurans TaxID=340221 RepID=A0A917I7S6_9HYPH|nr:type VI secretion system accessory protein TagJ [Alsobacter metallidurans]GGH20256.1 protein of avirulence locus [Alsobacter metallidurans]
MTTIGEALKAGDLKAALDAATAAVKAAPTDADARWLLAEVLVLIGDPERADKMLDAAALHDPNPAVLEFRKLLRAEVQRAQSLREGRAPRYQGGAATPAQQAAAKARVLLRASEIKDAIVAAEAVETLRPRAPATMLLADGTETQVDDLRDADDLFAAEFEVLTTGGDYMLVPVERVLSLEFDAPRRVRDLAWRRCAIDLKDGTDGIVFMPALYLGAAPETDDAFRLGRQTDWSDPARGPVRGRGLRTLLAGDDAVGLTEVARLTFA